MMLQTFILPSANVLFKTSLRYSRIALVSSAFLLTACLGSEDSINADNPVVDGSTSGGAEGGLTTDASPEVLQEGLDYYVAQCAVCHDDPSTEMIDGDLATFSVININNFLSTTQLVTLIAETMPPGTGPKCDGECAEATAAFIINGYRTSDEFELGDDDGDGVPNGEDACPTVDGTNGRGDGCPLDDDDQDGVPNVDDACPNEVGLESLAGCPAEVFSGDAANGEILYAEQQCSFCHDDAAGIGRQLFGNTPNSEIFDESGIFKCESVDCSDMFALSAYIVTDMPIGGVGNCIGDCANDITAYLASVASDGGVSNNGIVNVPDLPEPTDTPAPVADSDNDGVADNLDQCPNEAGTSADGCPEPVGISVPGMLEAEAFIAYEDADPGNQGEVGAADQDVDLVPAESGFGIGWIESGEWLEYDVTLAKNTPITVEARVASAIGGGAFMIEVDGVPVGSEFNVDNTGGWAQWTTVRQDIGYLGEGDHKLRINFIAQGFNLDYLSLSEGTISTPNLDSDNDGIPDSEDNCPNVSGGDNSVNGCPDSDGDGIADKDDECPNESGIADHDGCSQPAFVYSLAEGQAFYDSAGPSCTNCHDDPKVSVRGTLSSLGGTIVGTDGSFSCLKVDCSDLGALEEYIASRMPTRDPSLCEGDCAKQTAYFILETFEFSEAPDFDNDGINDFEDECFNSAGPASNNGCPLDDADDDGVADSDDACPNEAGPAENGGCPLDLDLTGQQIYDLDCAFCHGDGGAGIELANGTLSGEIILANWNQASMTTVIAETMPKGNVAKCDEECAGKVAEYLLSLAPETSCVAPEMLPRSLRLLTPTEYENTVVDLFGLDPNTAIADGFPITETVRGFDNNAQATSVSTTHMNQYWEASIELSETVSLDSLLNCGGLDDGACAQNFVETFGKLAFRRPLSDEEQADYEDLFLTAANNEEGARYVIRGMLVSPHFLYRSELGVQSGSSYVLTPYETATLLSYTFWGSAPDSALMTAADNGALSSPAQLRTQVTRLLADDRAAEQMVHFVKQWLHIDGELSNLDKDNIEYPEFNDQLAEAMETEIDLFVEAILLGGSTVFQDLFLADYTFANDVLANFYGLNGVSSSSFEQVDAGAERGGILNLAGLLASQAKRDQSSPILRGVMVREKLLCQEFPAPPANVGDVEPLDPNKTTRERFTAHTDNEGCALCHTKIDPIGFSFERYDGIGAYRETEGNSVAVDDSGYLEGLIQLFGSDRADYLGTTGLSEILAGADNVASCFVEHFHTYAGGVAEPDVCDVEDVSTNWKANNYSFSELWLQSVSTSNYLQRQ